MIIFMNEQDLMRMNAVFSAWMRENNMHIFKM